MSLIGKITLWLCFFIPFSFALSPTPSIDLNVLKLIVPLLFLWWLLLALLKKQLFLDTRPRFFLLLFFALFVGLSYFWTPVPTIAFRKILFLYSLIPMYFIVYGLFKTNSLSLQCLLKFLYFGGVVQALLSLIFFFSQFIFSLDATLNFLRNHLAPFFLGHSLSQLVNQYSSWLVDISGYTVLRTFGTFPDPHLFSLYLAMLLPIGLYLQKAYGNYQLKINFNLYPLFNFVILLAIVFSFSRGAYLALIFGSMFLLLYSHPIRIIKKNILFAYSLFLIILFLILIPNPLTFRLQSSFSLNEGSNSGRLAMWRVAEEIINEHPIFGIGLGGFGNSLNQSLGIRNPIYAHNLFLDFGAETGLINMFILLLLILSPILIFLFNIFITQKQKTDYLHNTLDKTIMHFDANIIAHLQDWQKFLTTSFLIFFVHSFFETPFFSVRVFTLFLILLAIPTTRITRQSSNTK